MNGHYLQVRGRLRVGMGSGIGVWEGQVGELVSEVQLSVFNKNVYFHGYVAYLQCIV